MPARPGARDLLSRTMSPRGRRPIPAEVLGARVRARREELGWFQADLAKAARTHNTYISRLEAGKVNPSLDVIVEVAFALGLNVATLTADLLPRERRTRRRGNSAGQDSAATASPPASPPEPVLDQPPSADPSAGGQPPGRPPSGGSVPGGG